MPGFDTPLTFDFDIAIAGLFEALARSTGADARQLFTLVPIRQATMLRIALMQYLLAYISKERGMRRCDGHAAPMRVLAISYISL